MSGLPVVALEPLSFHSEGLSPSITLTMFFFFKSEKLGILSLILSSLQIVRNGEWGVSKREGKPRRGLAGCFLETLSPYLNFLHLSGICHIGGRGTAPQIESVSVY